MDWKQNRRKNSTGKFSFDRIIIDFRNWTFHVL
jgi:hypothetical protein